MKTKIKLKKYIFFVSVLYILTGVVFGSNNLLFNSSIYAADSSHGGGGSSFGNGSSNSGTGGTSTNNSSATTADEMWQSASTWFGKIATNNNSSQAIEVVNEFVEMVNVIGTTIIVLATIILGIKYIIGSVESKTEVKESLVTLLVACIFFFGWTAISNIIIPDGRLVVSDVNDTTYKSMIGRIFDVGVFIANVASIAAIIFVGVKYIFSGASGKADLKGKSPYFIIGIIFAFCSVSFLNFLSDVINEIL